MEMRKTILNHLLLLSILALSNVCSATTSTSLFEIAFPNTTKHRSTANFASMIPSRNPVTGFEFSARPTDNYFSPWPPPQNETPIQWAPDILNLPAAWDRVRGHAFVAVIDSGIQISHPDLQASFRPHFAVNWGEGAPPSAWAISSVVDEARTTAIVGVCVSGRKGHGTHVAGLLAASPNDIGISGACWNCSLMIYIASSLHTCLSEDLGPPPSQPNPLYWESLLSPQKSAQSAAMSGAQVINMSFGKPYGIGFTHDQVASCVSNPNSCTLSYKENTIVAEWLHALKIVKELDVIAVMAVGNNQTNAHFPAELPEVIPVAGANRNKSVWYDPSKDSPPGQDKSESGSNFGAWVAAPASNILSTFYLGGVWNPALCIDSGLSSALPSPWDSGGYGFCNGTSMAAPHVSGIAALMRSVNPMISRDTVKNILASTAEPCVGAYASICGAGIANAQAAVQASLDQNGPPAMQGQAINRLTPLFAFYAPQQADHFYTTVPQMGFAAAYGSLAPQVPNGSQYQTVGRSVPTYSAFPSIAEWHPPSPRAQLSVFTSHLNPFSSTELIPLHRLSWRCPVSSYEQLNMYRSRSICSLNPSKAKHVYTTDATELASLKLSELGFSGASYVYDGIEGYVFPKTLAQPANTVKLCRKYNASTDDTILFPGTGPNGSVCGESDGAIACNGGVQCSYGVGYSGTIGGTDFIGYVYPLTYAQPIYTATAPVIPALPAIANGGFELPSVGSSYNLYNIADWTVGTSNLGGLSGNGSILGTSPAPEGTQIAFMKAQSYIQQTTTLDAGQYTLSFKTAQRPGYVTLGLRVLIDGQEVGQYVPTSTNFVTYTTPLFTIGSTGNHVVRIEPVGTDTTYGFALIDDVRLDAF